MPSLPPDDIRPVLVADLADDESRDVLDAAAYIGGRVCVPLDDAPVAATVHVLEVYIPSSDAPFLYLAEPLGPPTEDGFPLRIRHMHDAPPTAPKRPPTLDGIVRGKHARGSSPSLSPSHTKDLSQAGPLPKDPDADALLGRAIAGGKLTIESLIGRGGVGAVYRAMHRELRMPVAVKVLHESFQSDLDFCRRFYAEALAASRLDHANVTRVIDFGQEPDGLLYFAMEFLDGEELRSILERQRTMPAEDVAHLAMQVCAGLSHAHARGIIHRDIKPENLVLVPGHDDDGKPTRVVKVCDFGIAQHRGNISSATGVVAGTPEYMSPEQCRGDELDARSDVYSLGVVMYELATGQVPFLGERPQNILNKHQFTPALPPSKVRPGVDPLLERIIMKALAKDVGERHASMRELRAELRELLSPILTEASPPPSSVLGAPPPPSPAMAPPLPAAAPPLPAAAPPGPPPVPPPRNTSVRPAVPDVVPPLVVPPPRKPPVPASPTWLERSAHAGPASTAHLPAVRPDDHTAELLAHGAPALVQQLARTLDAATFAPLAARVEGTVRALAARGEVRTIWALSSALHGIAAEGAHGKGSRAAYAERTLRVFSDPAVLASVAEQELVGGEEARSFARRLLVNAGVAGAYGLYGARVKLAADPQIRAPFVAALKDFGPKAWPVVRAALEKILASDQNARAMDLAEDLLLCVASVGDESAGHLVVKYMRIDVAGVCRAATASIVKLWGERAKPLLVGMLQSKEDIVRIAGIAGLKQLGGIDEHVVPRLHAILAKRVPAGDELRAAAAVALGHVAPTAKQPAVSLLVQLVTPARPGGTAPSAFAPLGVPVPGARPGPTNVGAGTLSREDAVVVAAARSLLSVGGSTHRGLVAERAERSTEPLRGHLRRLLAPTP